MIRTFIFQFLTVTLVCLSMTCIADDSRIIATGGVTQVEGAAGGGIVPWAVIASYAKDEEVGVTAFVTGAETDTFKLDSKGIAVGLYDRYEFSLAKQSFDISQLGLPVNQLKQTIYGAKVKLMGDLIYDQLPQISLGIQHKTIDDFLIPSAVGAIEDSGTDWYIAASRLWLDGVAGYPVLTNLTLRSTKANQLGLLGFGGDSNDSEQLMWEFNTSLLIRRDMAIGYEYRQKPNNLGFAIEEDWQDVFVAWFYDKSLTGVLAWTELGGIAGTQKQNGLYLSVQGTF